MLFRERIAVYCENHKQHTDTLCGDDVRTSTDKFLAFPMSPTGGLQHNQNIFSLMG
jgi:hypothetical protein